MPDKSRKGKKAIDSKKSRAMRRAVRGNAPVAAPATARPVPAQGPAPVRPAPRAAAAAKYRYIAGELKRIGILAGIIVAILVALSLVLS